MFVCCVYGIRSPLEVRNRVQTFRHQPAGGILLMIGGLAAMLLAAILFPLCKEEEREPSEQHAQGLRFKRY